MKYKEIKTIFNKLERLHQRISKLVGEGTSWSITFPNDSIYKYTIKKFRDFESIQDDLENYLIWLWNLKDYYKSISENKQFVEDFVNKNYHLTILADLANSLKHSKLDNGSRSKIYPTLGKLNVKINQYNVASIIFLENEVEIDPKVLNDAELTLPILDQNGKVILDTFELLKSVEKDWLSFYTSFNII